ncbi:predicted protein [Methanosarcina acetivorans C2A]|uniref:Uncharacterized protein n=1 Tax=Methanosarcina acetivorans (strain ATCC 35395 / DSM 2834 / JCM 12185 / C2A) TaxID=188937 RepID=Q8TUF6_METAC|nr:predicted protein [Methanosarcina acetivorans C2A]
MRVYVERVRLNFIIFPSGPSKKRSSGKCASGKLILRSELLLCFRQSLKLPDFLTKIYIVAGTLNLLV